MDGQQTIFVKVSNDPERGLLPLPLGYRFEPILVFAGCEYSLSLHTSVQVGGLTHTHALHRGVHYGESEDSSEQAVRQQVGFVCDMLEKLFSACGDVGWLLPLVTAAVEFQQRCKLQIEDWKLDEFMVDEPSVITSVFGRLADDAALVIYAGLSADLIGASIDAIEVDCVGGYALRSGGSDGG